MLEDRRQHNIQAIRHYLMAAFPGRAVEEFAPPKHGGHGFRVRSDRDRVVVTTDQFLEDTEESELVNQLDEWGLVERLRRLPIEKVVELRTSGLFIEPISKY